MANNHPKVARLKVIQDMASAKNYKHIQTNHNNGSPYSVAGYFQKKKGYKYTGEASSFTLYTQKRYYLKNSRNLQPMITNHYLDFMHSLPKERCIIKRKWKEY